LIQSSSGIDEIMREEDALDLTRVGSNQG